MAPIPRPAARVGPRVRPVSDRRRVVIVGAGPQGLTAAVYLVHSGLDPDDLDVVDPTGRWLDWWHRWFAHLGIDHLRSPAVHHPHPHPYALLDFARERQRSNELAHTYSLPSTELFADFCAWVVADSGLDRAVIAGRVCDVDRSGVLRLADGRELHADHVVWATNPSIPTPLPTGCQPAVRWDAARPVNVGKVAVVGGGLTAAHLVERAIESGAHVEWLTRRPVVERHFDTDPGWLGPKEMGTFSAESDPDRRLELVIAARDGGSVPPWMLDRLAEFERSGRLCRRVGGVEVAESAAGRGLVCGGVPIQADEYWFATGDRPCVTAAPPLARLVSELGVRCRGGRPILDRSLRLPGSVVHVMGRFAQLELGPTAGNLAGARRGAEMLVGAVLGADAMFELAGV